MVKYRSVWPTYFSATFWHWSNHPDSNVHVANMGPTWGRQEPGGPHVGHTDFAIWAYDYQNVVKEFLTRNLGRFSISMTEIIAIAYTDKTVSIFMILTGYSSVFWRCRLSWLPWITNRDAKQHSSDWGQCMIDGVRWNPGHMYDAFLSI